MNPPAPAPVAQRLRERTDRTGGPDACWPLVLGSQEDNLNDMAQKRRAGRRTLTDDQVIAIRHLAAEGATKAECARAIGCSDQTAGRVIDGRCYRYVEEAAVA